MVRNKNVYDNVFIQEDKNNGKDNFGASKIFNLTSWGTNEKTYDFINVYNYLVHEGTQIKIVWNIHSWFVIILCLQN